MKISAHFKKNKFVLNKLMTLTKAQKALNKIKQQYGRQISKKLHGNLMFEPKLAQNNQPSKNRRRNIQRRRKRKGALATGPSFSAFPRGMQKKGFGVNRQRMVVCEDENIGIITSPDSTAFNILSTYPINPGQATTFPWLSSIAKNFEKYRFQSLEFYVVPQVSQFANGGRTGEVILSCDYDASDAAPGSYQQQADQVPHSTAMPYQRQSLVLSPKEMHKESDAKFIRPGGLPGASDIKTYDAGNFFVGCTGLDASVFNVCSLHVRYSCELTIPVLENFAQAPVNNSVTYLVDSQAVLTTATPYQPLLAAVKSTALPVTNGLGVVNTAGSIVPTPGNYILNCSVQMTNTSNVLGTGFLDVLKNGVVQIPEVTGASAEYKNTTATNTSLTLNVSIFVSCNGTDAIALELDSVFAAGVTTATTTFMLTAI